MKKDKQKMIEKLSGIARMKYRWSVVVAVVFGVIYTLSMPKDRIGYGDSDEFMAMAWKQGVMKSPGYPLYLVMLKGMMKLFEVGMGKVWGAHFLSVVLACTGLGVMFLLLWSLCELVAKKDKRKYVLVSDDVEAWVLAMVGVGMLGFSGLYWTWGQVAERYALSWWVMIVVLYMLVKIRWGSVLSSSKWMLVVALLMGLGISHEWLVLAMVPVMGYVSWKRYGDKYDQYLKLVIVGLMGLVTPFLWLVKMNQNRVSLSWIIKPDVSGLVKFVSQGYWGDGFMRAEQVSGLVAQARVDVMLKLLVKILEFGVESYGWWSVVLVVGVVIYHQQSRKKHEVYWVVLGAWVSAMLALLLVLELTEDRFALVLEVPQYVMVYVLAVPVLWFGVRELMKRWGEAGMVLFKEKRERIDMVLVVGLMAPVVFCGWMRWTKSNMEKNNVTSQVYARMIEEMEENSLVVCFQHHSCQGLDFEQKVMGRRQDVVVVPYYFHPDEIRLQERVTWFEYEGQPWVVFDVITNQVGKRKVYAIDLTDNYYKLLGFDYGFLRYIPRGYYGELGRDLPDELTETTYPDTVGLLKVSGESWNLMLAALKARVARRHVFNAGVYLKYGERELAYEESNLAANVIFQISPGDRENLDELKEAIERTKPSRFFRAGESVEQEADMLKEVDNLRNLGAVLQAVVVARGTVVKYPQSARAREVWADALAAAGASESAMLEYENTLKLEGGNRNEVEQKLEFVKGFVNQKN